MTGWFDDVEEVEASEDEPSMFEVRLSKCVEGGVLGDITLPVLSQNIGDVEDGDVLRAAYRADDREPAHNVYATRMEELGVPIPTEDVEEPETVEADAVEDEEGSTDGEVADAVESAEASVETATATAEVEADPSDVEETESAEEAPTASDGGRPKVSVDVNTLAPGAVSVQDAAALDYRWMVMMWADPGEGKTYFSHTAPGPIMYIDTEGKAHDIADKFTDKEVYYFQPNDYWEAVDALDDALSVLDAYREGGVTGTIVVDSMSIMWEWAQTAYKKKYYPNQDPADVKLKSGLASKGGDPDWPEIKAMHNDRFRERMVESPYHLVWTAMRQDDYSPVFDGEEAEPADKPGGEKNNVYKVNHILRVERNDRGIPVARLQKSGRSKYNFRGLPFPTWETFTEAVETLSAEEDDLSHGDTFTTPSGIELQAVLGKED